MDISSLVELPETEKAFRDWLRRYPSGFVINAWKIPTISQTARDPSCGIVRTAAISARTGQNGT
jgi:hypothetical protein